MPFSVQQRRDLELHQALERKDLKKIKQLLDTGANPLAVVKIPDGTVFDLLGMAIESTDENILKLIVDHINQSGKEINFNRHLNDDPENENMWQYAELTCKGKALDVIKEYAKSRKLDTTQLLNAPIIQLGLDKKPLTIPFPQYVMLKFTPSLMLNNYATSIPSISFLNKHQAFIKDWKANTDDKSVFDTKPYFGNEKDAPNFELNGWVDILNRMIRNGLRITEEDVLLAQTMYELSQNPESCKELMDKLIYEEANVQFQQDSFIINDKGKVQFKAIIKNLYDKLPVVFTMVPALEKLRDAMEKALKEQAQDSEINERLRKHSEDLAEQGTHVKQHSGDLKTVPSVIIGRARPKDEKQAQVYDIIANALQAKFDAEKLKGTGVFQINLTDKTAKNTKAAAFVLQSLVSLVPVWGNDIVQNAIDAASSKVASGFQRQHDKEINAKLHAAVGAALTNLAVKVALKLSESVNIENATKAAEQVYSQYNKLNECAKNDEAVIVEFLCAPVERGRTLTFNKSKSQHSSGSSTSAKVSVEDAQPSLGTARIQDKEAATKKPPKRKSTGCFPFR